MHCNGHNPGITCILYLLSNNSAERGLVAFPFIFCSNSRRFCFVAALFPADAAAAAPTTTTTTAATAAAAAVVVTYTLLYSCNIIHVICIAFSRYIHP